MVEAVVVGEVGVQEKEAEEEGKEKEAVEEAVEEAVVVEEAEDDKGKEE